MKILPIQQNNLSSFLIEKRVLPNSGVQSPQYSIPEADAVSYGKFQVNFCAGISNIPKALDLIPLDDKIAYAMQQINPCEFLIAAKDIISQAPKLRECVASAPFLIRKISVLTDKNIKEPLMFTKMYDGSCVVFNPNKIPLFLNGFLPVGQNEAAALNTDDRIVLPNQVIIIKDEPGEDFNFEKYKEFFLKEYNFEKDVQEISTRYNLQKLSQLITPRKEKDCEGITFAQIGGQKGVIDTLKKRILFPMKYPDVFKNNSMNHGVILYGPPGTGKSLIAEALANEAEAAVFKLCATELTSKWLGESEKNWRKLFTDARSAQPSIIYIDEFDAIARQRGGNDTYGDKLINQVLSLLSDVEKNKDNVYLVAATNNYEILDPAILRSGRFGLHLEVKSPDLEGTKEILKIHSQRKPMSKDFNPDEIAEMMYAKKMTGADIAAVLDSAYSNAFERLEFYKCMDNGTFTPSMMSYFEVNKEDLLRAIDEFESKKKIRQPIGYNSGK